MKDIPPIETAPILIGGCKTLAILLSAIIFLFPILTALFFWYIYEKLFISIGVFLFLQIVSGVIVSRIRSISVSIDQGEMSYSTYEIISWYLDKYICTKKDDTTLHLVKKNHLLQ